VFTELKEKQRRLRADFPPDMGLRVHRALSWVQRAEAADEDFDAAFIFYWIAFNAAYADDREKALRSQARSAFEDFFNKLVRLDRSQRMNEALWGHFPDSVKSFLTNPFVFQPFWNHHNQVPGTESWERSFDESRVLAQKALFSHNTVRVLSILFDRLYVLRNQVLHGGATWNSSVNRNQVRDGARILGFLVPVFIDLMMDHPDEDWGAPHYPVVEAP
jgi:hypothetical protein